MPGFAPYMQLHMAKERGYLSFPQVEDAVAGYLSSASPTMRLGQKPLLTELALSLGEDHPSVAELRCATDLSLRLTRCTSQALGRVMGAAVATQKSLWLTLAKL